MPDVFEAEGKILYTVGVVMAWFYIVLYFALLIMGCVFMKGSSSEETPKQDEDDVV